MCATFYKDPGTGRGMSSTGTLIVDTFRGQLRVRAWPRKRGKSKDPDQAARNEWFAQVHGISCHAPAKDQLSRAAQTRNTVLLPRDVLMKALAGRLIGPIDTDTGKLYPVSYRDDVSDSLDALGQTNGALLIRLEDLWQPLAPGLNQEVLAIIDGVPTFVPVTELPGASSAADSGVIDPPSPTDFPKRIQMDGAECFVADTGHMALLTRDSPGVRAMGVYMPITGNKHRMRARIRWQLDYREWNGLGFGVYDENNNAQMQMRFVQSGFDDKMIIHSSYHSAPGHNSASTNGIGIRPMSPVFCEFTWDDRIMKLAWGMTPDTLSHEEVHDYTDQSFVATHIGFVVDDSTEEHSRIAMLIDRFSHEAL